jgi:hypothetical protein
MVTCAHCGSTSVLRDEVFRLAGEGGVIRDAPSLIRLDEEVQVQGQRLMPVGLAQFDYGRGWWDEFWCLDADAAGYWLSADEGDYALEQALPRADWPKRFRPKLGAEVEIGGTAFRVTEAETATCVAVRGAFPEVLEVGESHLYFDLTGPDGEIATHERWDGGEGWSIGRWIDPWEVGGT